MKISGFHRRIERIEARFGRTVLAAYVSPSDRDVLRSESQKELSFRAERHLNGFLIGGVEVLTDISLEVGQLRVDQELDEDSPLPFEAACAYGDQVYLAHRSDLHPVSDRK